MGQVSGKTDYQLFLCNSGAEANENALKLASFYNGRKKVIAFSGAFHGRTSLAVSATDNPKIIAPVNETDNIVFLPHNDVAALENAFQQFGDEIAAVIIEGIQGVGGIKEASIPFLQEIRRFAMSIMPFTLPIVCNVVMAEQVIFIRMIMQVLRLMFIPWQKAWAMVFRLVVSVLHRSLSHGMVCWVPPLVVTTWLVLQRLPYWK